jgi:hypothetical protein
MIGRIAVAAACGAAVSACAAAGPIPVRGEPAGSRCNDSNIQQFVGREATSDLGAEMQRVSGAAIDGIGPTGWVSRPEQSRRAGQRLAVDHSCIDQARRTVGSV